jgi:hypothetical protein
MKNINSFMCLNMENRHINKLNCFGDSKNIILKNKFDTYYDYENELITHFIKIGLI